LTLPVPPTAFVAVCGSVARKKAAAAPLRLPQTVAAGMKAEAGAVVAVL
jgi:hypothetical protein